MHSYSYEGHGQTVDLMGTKVIIDDVLMAEFVEDWSRVRSKSRAERRRRRGFKQNIDMVPSGRGAAIRIGGTIIVNSKTYAKLKREAQSQSLEWSGSQDPATAWGNAAAT